MGDAGVPTETGRHLLGPHVVGQRIVVRRVLPDQTGPSGGPAMTDVLGVCEAWGEQVLVRREDGEVISIERTLIVSGKPVPPRPSRFARVPTRTFEEVFDHRWRVDPAGPQEAMAIGLSTLVRRTRSTPLPDGFTMRHQPVVTYEWLLGNSRAQDNFERVAASLDLPDQTYVSIEENGAQVARGRVNLVGDWAHFADLTVQPSHLRRRLATAVIGELAEWAAAAGATKMALNVNIDNDAALALYNGLGFEPHHRGHKLREKVTDS